MTLVKTCIIVLAITLLSFPACSPSTQPPAENMRLRIAYNPWPGYFPLVIAREKGFFKKYGLEVELVLRQDALQQMAEFAARAYDGAALSLGSVITIASRTRDIKILVITDRSDGADAVAALPEISSPADLRGKRIGTLLGAYGELFVLAMLEQAGLSEKDVLLVNTDGSQIPSLLRDKKIDAGQTWEPFISRSLKTGAHIIYSSKDSDLILDVIAFHQQAISSKPQAIRAFISGWFEAVQYCLREPQQARQLIARTLNIPAEECSFDGIKLFTREDNRHAFAAAAGFESIHAVGEVYAGFYLRTGNADMPIDMSKLLDPSFF